MYENKIILCLFGNSQRMILGYFKLVGLLIMILIKSVEFNNYLWYVCYVLRVVLGILN